MNLAQVQFAIANVAGFEAAMARVAQIINDIPPEFLSLLTRLREQRDRDKRRAAARSVHVQYRRKSRGHR